MPWTEKLYDAKNLEELNSIVLKNSHSKTPLVLLEFNHRQLGFTDEWLRERIAEAMAEGDAVLADFLNIWVEGSSMSPIDRNLLKVLSDSVINEPYIRMSTSGYVTRWYVTEDAVEKIKSREIVISLDTSDAVGKDDIALVIRDVRTGAVLAVGQYNETNLITFSEWLIDILKEFMKSTMIVERRSSGVAILDNLLKLLPVMGLDPFRRLFNWVVNDADENPERVREFLSIPLERRDETIYTRYRKHFGFATSGSGRTGRDQLYGNNLLAAIKYTGNKAKDKTLVQQISGLTVKNGRIDHSAGNHDDIVIAWVLSYWFLTVAKNKHIYGIANNIILSSVITDGTVSVKDQEKVAHHREQLAMRNEINDLLEKLKKEVDITKSTILTNKIRYIYSNIDNSLKNNYNIETMIDAINMEKKKILNSGGYNNTIANNFYFSA